MMIKVNWALLSLGMATFVAISPVRAQQQKEHTLGHLWPKVEEVYPGIAAKMATVDAAKLNQKVVRGDGLPQIQSQLQNTYGTYSGSSGAFFPQGGLLNVSGPFRDADDPRMAANALGSVLVQWEFFSFGKIQKQNEAAAALYQQSVFDKENYVLGLKKVLSDRYIALIYHAAKLKWAYNNTQRLDEIRKISAGLAASGLRPAADSLLANSSYVQALGENHRWSGLKSAALIHVLELYPEDTVYYQASAARFENPIVKPVIQDRLLHDSHPVLESWGQRSQFYQASGEAHQRASWPSIHVLGGYVARGTGIEPQGAVSSAWVDGFQNGTQNIIAGIGLTWNLTGLYTKRTKGQQFFKESEGAKWMQKHYQQTMKADLSGSQVKILQQFEQLQKTNQAVKQSQQAFEMYLARYKNGLIPLSELLQIRTLLEQAEHVHMEASRDYWLLLAYEAELTADFDFLFNNL